MFSLGACMLWFFFFFFFFFKQKTAYEIVSRDWSSDVCSSDLYIDLKGTGKSLNLNEILLVKELMEGKRVYLLRVTHV